MIHYNTTNNSFLKVHLFLKKKGIKNNTFFLELVDSKLENVNPFDEDNLTQDMKLRIVREITVNPWYFFREILRIPAAGLIRFELNLGNLAAIWCALNSINHYLILPRQIGKTQCEMAVYLWLLYFGGRNINLKLFAQSDTKIDDNLTRIKTMRDNLPKYLQLKQHTDKNGETISYSTLGNSVSGMAPARSVSAANQKFRGESYSSCNYDEFGFIPFIEQQYRSSVLAYMESARKAEKNGQIHYISVTTTAGFLNTDEGVFAYNFKNNCFDFTEKLYDLSIGEVSDLIRNNAKNNFIYIEYQYWDLGKGDDYFEEQCRALEYDQDAIDREVLCRWKAVSTVHPLGQKVLQLLEQNKRSPEHTVVLNKLFRMKLYADPEVLDWSRPYIIGGDCANNVGSDYSALVILDPYTYEVIATIRTNMYSSMLFAKMIADLMKKYFYRSILVLERNLNGATVIDRIVEEDFNLTSRIYGPLDEKTKQVKMFGINTTEQSRKLIYGQILKIAVDDSFDRIYDRVIIDEISSLIITRSGRIDHPVGGHDDLLISYLFTRWFLLYGNNIDRYIDPTMVGCLLHEFEEHKDDEAEMRSITNERLSEINVDKKMQERRANIENKLSANNRRILSIADQHNAILNGSFETNKSMHGTPDNIINGLSTLLADRYDPNVKEQIDRQSDNGKLYTLDDEEMKKEEDKLFDSQYQMNDYNRNMKENINSNIKEINTPAQIIRQERSYSEADEIDDLKYFFKHL